MKIETKPSDGIILIVISKVLYVIAYPLDSLHELLKKCFIKKFKNIFKNWNENEIEDVFLEIWSLIWMMINIFIILQFIYSVSLVVRIIFAAILIMRVADFTQMFIIKNLQWTNKIKGSVSRSYISLLFATLEIGAILSSFHFLISDKFYVGTELANWKNVYFYTLRNIFTVGGGEIYASTNSASFFFGVIRVVEPMFGVLVFTVALTRAIAKPSNSA